MVTVNNFKAFEAKHCETAATKSLLRHEDFDITGLAQGSEPGSEPGLEPGREVAVRARREDGAEIAFTAIARLDTPVEVDYFRNGGVLHTILRRLAGRAAV